MKNNELLFIISLLLAFFFANSGMAIAEEEPSLVVPPSDRFYWASLSIIRYNPLGLETQNRLMYSKRLADSSSLLFRDTFLALGLSVKLNPAYVKAGGLVDFQPIAFFNLRLGYEFNSYFGTQGYLQSFPVADADYDDDTMKKNKKNAYATKGHHYFAEPTLQMKFGKIAARSKFGFEYWDLDLHQDDKYFYDATLDTLVPVKKIVWTNDTDLLYMNGQLTPAPPKQDGCGSVPARGILVRQGFLIAYIVIPNIIDTHSVGNGQTLRCWGDFAEFDPAVMEIWYNEF